MNEEELVQAAMKIPGRCWSEELAFLYQLACMAPPNSSMVELGTFQGRTAAMLCAAAQKKVGSEVFTIDNYVHDGAFTGNYKAVAEDPDYGKSPKEYAELTYQNLAKLGFQPRVIIGDSATVLKEVEKVGLLFVDSEHTRRRFDFECGVWLPLIIEGGILACHDYKQPEWPWMTRAIDDRIEEEEWEPLGLVKWLVAFKKRTIRRSTMTEDEKKAIKKRPKKELPEITLRDNMVVGGPRGGIWVIEGGKRRSVVNVRNQIAMGIGMHHVVVLHPEQLDTIPEGEPMPLIRR